MKSVSVGMSACFVFVQYNFTAKILSQRVTPEYFSVKSCVTASFFDINILRVFLPFSESPRNKCLKLIPVTAEATSSIKLTSRVSLESTKVLPRLSASSLIIRPLEDIYDRRTAIRGLVHDGIKIYQLFCTPFRNYLPFYSSLRGRNKLIVEMFLYEGDFLIILSLFHLHLLYRRGSDRNKSFT